MAEIDWTPALVEERLSEAAEVMARLPPVRVQGYFNTWPTIVPEFSDRVGRAPPVLRRPLPTPDAITRMEEALAWLRWLEPEDARLVWARVEGKPWKALCWRFGLSRATANRRWDYALTLIAWRLQGRAVPATWSRRFLRERARFVSSGK